MSGTVIMTKEIRRNEQVAKSNVPVNLDSISKQNDNDSLKTLQSPIDAKIKKSIQSEPQQVLILQKSRLAAIEHVAT